MLQSRLFILNLICLKNIYFKIFYKLITFSITIFKDKFMTDKTNIKLEAKQINRKNISKNEEVYFGENNPVINTSSFATIDKSLLNELTIKTKDAVNLSSVLYRRPDIFVGAENFEENVVTYFGTVKKHRSVVMSQVISVSVSGQHIKSLMSPLTIDNTIKEEKNKSLSTVHSSFSNISDTVKSTPGSYRKGEILYKVIERCVFWNFESSTWSSDGCKTIKNEFINSTRNIKCSCTHMTHFAVILVSI